MGNLGWFEPKENLIATANNVLTQARVPAEDILRITAATGRGELGSACEIVFRDPKTLQNARVKVRMLRRVAGDREGAKPTFRVGPSQVGWVLG